MTKTITRRPVKTTTDEFTVTAYDKFTKQDVELKGSVKAHKYADGSAILFAKVKTPNGPVQLHDKYNPETGWENAEAEHSDFNLSFSWPEAIAQARTELLA